MNSISHIYIKNSNVILKDRILKGATIEITGAKIAAVDSRPVPLASLGYRARNDETIIIDAKGSFVSPGFIDCHIHGSPRDIFLNEAKYGTTAFVITQSCAPLDSIYKRVDEIKEFIKSDPLGKNVLGVRLEGPYINKAKAGAQNPDFIRTPDAKELSEILRKIGTDTFFLRKKVSVPVIMTIAPELKGARPLINILRKHGIIASIGHSDATFEAAMEGIDAGISHATHTFNAMSGLDRREPGVVGAVLLDDRVTTEIILDLVHVHKALFELLLKLKKRDKVVIVTDSLTSEIASPRQKAAGLAMTGGAYRFEDGRLAGSSLTMIGALKNAVRRCNVPLLDAIQLITLNPAKFLGVEDKKGTIVAGKDADIVIFDKNFDVKATLICGKIAYSYKL